MFARVAALASRAIASSSSQSQMLSQLAFGSLSSSSFSSPPLSLMASIQRNMATNSTDIFNVHRDSPENNRNTPFEIKPEDMRRIDEVVARYPPNYKASAVIPVLDLVQQMNGGSLSLTAMNKVAAILEMPEIRVYEVATFYTMFNRSKIGKYHVLICGTTPCRLNGAEKIEKALVDHLGIHIGETTPDGVFTLGEMECMGACVNAPMIAVADYSKGTVEDFSYIYYEDLSAADAIKIVDTLKKGDKPRVGSQYREKAEPAGAMINSKWVPKDGATTLMGQPRGPYVTNPALN